MLERSSEDIKKCSARAEACKCQGPAVRSYQNNEVPAALIKVNQDKNLSIAKPENLLPKRPARWWGTARIDVCA